MALTLLLQDMCYCFACGSYLTVGFYLVLELLSHPVCCLFLWAIVQPLCYSFLYIVYVSVYSHIQCALLNCFVRLRNLPQLVADNVLSLVVNCN